MIASTGARNPRAMRSSRQPFHASKHSPPHETAAELAAVLPAILDRAFKGDLL
jgi:hypothetical protein